MVPGLRKRHRRIWLLLALVLPFLYLYSVLSLPSLPGNNGDKRQPAGTVSFRLDSITTVQIPVEK